MRGEGGTAPAKVSKTGQTESYAAGDDGDKEAGTEWPGSRFTDNGNGAVTDNLTGLVWLKQADCYKNHTWTEALAFAKRLADGKCGLSDESATGRWRLPNRKELLSLMNRSEAGPALPGDNMLSNVSTAQKYWTSTPKGAEAVVVWRVGMSNGLPYPTAMDAADGYALFVRDSDDGQQFELTVNPAGTGSGKVTGTGGLNCIWNGSQKSGACSVKYNPNTQVTITGAADTGSYFAGWSEVTGSASNCTGTGDCGFKITQDSSVRASFDLKPSNKFILTVAPSGPTTGTAEIKSDTGGVDCTWNGAVPGGKCVSDSISSGTPITLTATLPAGTLVTWGTGCDVATGTTCKINSLITDKTITATFGGIIVKYRVTPSAVGHGSIDPNTVQEVDADATIDFTVTPDTGYYPVMSGTCGGHLEGNKYTTNAITADCTVVATFEQNTPGEPIDLPKTGRTKCSDASGEIACADTGQDGEIQAGMAWPAPRFTDNTDGTVTDNLTGLVWLKDANCINTQYQSFDNDGTSADGAVTWQHALAFVAGINSGSYSNCGASRTDWRLPNINELESIYNAGKTWNQDWLNSEAFDNAQYVEYWSSTSDAADTTYAFSINIADGNIYSKGKSSDKYVWPVRGDGGTAPAKVSKTGQATSYAAGDDGAIQAGAQWPGPRFTDNTDGTVTDNLTGLVWLKKADCYDNHTWTEALTFANNLANNNCELTDNSAAGDWRLPNLKELLSLIDRSKADPALPAANLFGNVSAGGKYWTSTPRETKAWRVGMSKGLISPTAMDAADGYALFVKGGEYYGDPDISADPSSKNFGSVDVGSASQPQTFIITNNGANNLYISGVSIKGANSGEFGKTDDNCSPEAGQNFRTIGPDETCTVDVTFSPASAGAKTANLSIPSNDPDTPELNIALSGAGGGAQQYTLTVTKDGTGTGTVTAGANCTLTWIGNTGTCTADNGKEITLSGSAAAGSTFEGWSSGTGSASSCAGTGDCTFTIAQDSSVKATFEAQKADQTITFGALSDKTADDPAFVVTATASSGLPVSFSSQTGNVCTVSGNTVTLTGETGQCTIRASQAGDANYNAALDVDRSFSVTAGALDHITISPATATIALGESRSYTTEAFDQYDNSRGDVTGGTTFSIAPDGSCAGNSCTPTQTGAHTVTGIYSGKTAQATLNVNAAGEAIDLPKTGQVKCYNSAGTEVSCENTGQDGNIQAGMAWPTPRFTVGAGTEADCVTDELTGLVWSRNGNLPNGQKTWQQALDYITALNAGYGLCGHNDWRLPNINELESLVNEGQESTVAWLNGQGFINVRTDLPEYWSSTTVQNTTTWAWIVGMWDGRAGFDIKDGGDLYVLPVRGTTTTPAEVWQTGQTKCYDSSGNELASCAGTGQDGDIQAGVVWPSPRFTDNGNGTVTDNLTELMWTGDAGAPTIGTCTGGTRTWQGALDYVSCLNNNNYLGHTDWRLPNVKEFQSLIHAGQTLQATWLDTQGFTNVQQSWYWSSTTRQNSTESAKIVGMGWSSMDANDKSAEWSVWPVRGGTVPPQYTLDVTKDGTGTGTVTSSPLGIDCGSDCSESYASGTDVTLTATASAGSTFAGWSGDCDTNGQVTVNDNKTCKATFNPILPNQHTLTVTKAGTGTGTVTAGANCTLTWIGNTGTCTADDGKEITLSGSAAAGSTFEGWSEGTGSASSCAGTGDCTFTIDQDSSVKATFEAILPNQYTVTVDPSGPTTGTAEIKSDTGGVDCTWDGAASGGKCISDPISSGTAVTLTATLPAGTLVTWGTGCNEVTETTCRINSLITNITITATFSTYGQIDLPKTGQVKCYDLSIEYPPSGDEIACDGTGQDGDIQAGVQWPGPRFTVGAGTEAECVTDNLTGLIWSKNGNLPNGAMTWQQALDYITALNAGNGLCGHTDWRLPNSNELGRLVNAGPANSATWLDGQGFTDVQSDWYWSSTTSSDSKTMALVWNMSYGQITTADKGSNSYYLWPVRGTTATPAEVWQTGQTKCYDSLGNELASCAGTGQDGDIQAGVAWPSPRFTDNGNGTVTDNLTGLVWLKNANCSGIRRAWADALNDANTLTTGSCGLTDGSQAGDWRLPNINELESLANAGEANTATWLNGQGFINVQGPYYWSATTIAAATDAAWLVDMRNVVMVPSFKGPYYSYYIWPVRGGTVPPQYTLTSTKDGTGTGTVTSSPLGIDCGSDCSQGYASGTPVTLTATADPGSTFGGWSEGTGAASSCAGTGDCTFTIDQDSSVKATFEAILPNQYTVTVDPSGPTTGTAEIKSDTGGVDCTWDGAASGGKCISDPISSGTAVTLTATLPAGTLVTWGTGCNEVTETTCRINSLITNITITATFSTYGQIDLPKTGQVKCYNSAGTEVSCENTGQDGNIQAGMAWPEPRFTVGAGTEADCVTDELTGLVWSRNGNLPNGRKSWQQALDYITALNAGNGLCGHNDWRLPNINELESLVNVGQENTGAWLNTQGFTNMQYSTYWSSTTQQGATTWAWIVGMWDGRAGFDIKDGGDLYVLPVRGTTTTPAEVWQTGQTKCYDSSGNELASCAGTGQDGDIQAGVVWPSPRFTDNGNGTVTDNLTELMWTGDAGAPTIGTCTGGTRTWQGALDYVSCLNNNNYLGHTDWRLPNVKEFQSLIHAGQTLQATWLDTQGFTNVQQSWYWSSTTTPIQGYGMYAEPVDMVSGAVGFNAKNSVYNIWPVRGGTVPPQYTLDVTKDGTGTGTVTSSPLGIDCGSDCSESYASGTDVTLTATASAGSTFAGWSGDCDTNGQVTVNDNKTCKATFNPILPNQHTLTVTKAGTGTGTVTAGANCTLTWIGNTGTCTADDGKEITLSGSAAAGSTFEGWSEGTGSASSCAGTGDCTFTIDQDSSVKATFEAILPNQYTVTVDPSGPTTGTAEIKSDTGGVDCTWDGAASGGKCISDPISSGTAVTLTATLPAGTLVTWGTGCNEVTETTCKINSLITNITITATFSTYGQIDLPKTGQTKCYDSSGEIACADTGQDGEIQAGAAWPAPRFTDNTDGTVTDNLTGLMWAQQADTPEFIGTPTCAGGAKTWQDALDYVKCLNDNNYLNHEDWRLPNINELESIYNAGETWNHFWLNAQGFVSVSYVPEYWTSTTYAADAASAISMNIADGNIYTNTKDGSRHAWPVRGDGGTAPAKVSKTGQATSYAAGDDGDKQAGAQWPGPRFTDNTDGTVTDYLTGLVWLKKADCYDNHTWTEALTFANNLANNNCELTDNSAAGALRLPNLKELLSLIDRSKADPALPEANLFGNVSAAGKYWTSTPKETKAWRVGMSKGLISPTAMDAADGYALFVKGGEYYGDPDISADPSSKNFGSVDVGSASQPQTFIITNNGANNLYISGVSITGTNSGEFGKTDDNCSPEAGQNFRTIGPDETCTVDVTFSPASAGAKTANLSIPSNDPDTPELNIALSGTGGGGAQQYTLTVTKDGTGTGTVTSSPLGIDCGSDCSESYASGTPVTLTATADTGSYFAGWSGDCTGTTSSLNVLMDKDKTCTASFTMAGDCNRDGKVIAVEVQAAMNMYFGSSPVSRCVDTNLDGKVSASELQAVMNNYSKI